MILGWPSSIQSALTPGGPQAAHLAHLWWIFFWVCLAVYVITIAFLVWAVIRSRRNATPDLSAPTERRLAIGVGTATALSIVTLFALLITSVATGRDVGTFAHDDPRQVEIEVTGHQWWWEVKYPQATITTANEIHIPIGMPILLRLATSDVIHSIWIPSLHGKRDLINGRINQLRIEADTPGIYRGQCAEYCGVQHAHMALVVIAESPEAFAAWKAHQSDFAKTPPSDAALRGQQLFLGAPCHKCHNIAGVNAAATIGPDLTHLKSRRTIAAGTLINNRGNLAGWINNAPSIKPGTSMPQIAMTGSQLNDLLAYLETLR